MHLGFGKVLYGTILKWVQNLGPIQIANESMADDTFVLKRLNLGLSLFGSFKMC